MSFLRWLGGIIVLVWLLAFIFSWGGTIIHWLLLIAAIVFIMDLLFGRDRDQKNRN